MLPNAHLTSNSRMSWCDYLGHKDLFLYSSSVYSCHLFLISSASVRSIQFLSFIVPMFAWNIPLVSLIFLKRSLVFPILLFPLFRWIGHWGMLSYLSLLFFGTLHSNGYVFPFLLCFSSFLSYCKASSDSHFAFFAFFLWMVLITASRSDPLNLFVTSFAFSMLGSSG